MQEKKRNENVLLASGYDINITLLLLLYILFCKMLKWIYGSIHLN